MVRRLRRNQAAPQLTGSARTRCGRPCAALAASLLALILTPGVGYALNEDLYAEILERFTREVSDTAGTRVDYTGLQRSARWRELLASLEHTDPEKIHSRRGKLAFWTNAYNILAIDTVVRNQPLESIREVGSIFRSVWAREAGTIAGRSVTLDEIEHKILRPMGEPRIHAAIVCASVSCPPLSREPYRAVRLDAQLDSALRRWLADPRKGLRIDRASKTVYLSRVFDWFGEDFEDRGGVLSYLRAYVSDADREWLSQATSIDVAYFDYDWSLNGLKQ